MGKKCFFEENEIIDIIKKYTIENLSCEKIGILYNVSSTTISRNLKKNKIEIKKCNEYKKYTVNEEFLKNVNGINSYFIGLMASDGNVKKNFRCFSISQSGINGMKLIEQISNWLAYSGKIYHARTSCKISHGITITSEKLVSEVIKHNIVPNKSAIFYYNNLALLKEFLQGYVDGDGCVGIYKKNGKNYYYISFFGTTKFMKSIISLIPIIPTCYKINENYHEIKFFGKKGIDFSNWLWEYPVYSDSIKYKKYVLFKANEYLNSEKYQYNKLNIDIMNMLDKNFTVKEICDKHNINKRTVYNLKYNKKNGRGTY